MSSYTVIARVSDALRAILWEAFRTDPVIHNIIGSQQEIVFRNPTETARDSANRLSLWLHQITENEFVKNQPMQRGDDSTSSRFPPLALNLYYLVTPFAPSGDPESEHLLLGKTMQVLYDNAILALVDNTPGEEVAEELRIIYCRLSLEELTRIWEALREPYRLSVCYQVRVTRIESQRIPGTARILDHTTGYGQKRPEAARWPS
jgi:hypothetical protein